MHATLRGVLLIHHADAVTAYAEANREGGPPTSSPSREDSRDDAEGKGDGQTQGNEAVDGSRVRSKPARRWRARPCRDQTQAQAKEAPCQGRLSNVLLALPPADHLLIEKRTRPIRAFLATPQVSLPRSWATPRAAYIPAPQLKRE